MNEQFELALSAGMPYVCMKLVSNKWEIVATYLYKNDALYWFDSQIAPARVFKVAKKEATFFCVK